MQRPEAGKSMVCWRKRPSGRQGPVKKAVTGLGTHRFHTSCEVLTGALRGSHPHLSKRFWLQQGQLLAQRLSRQEVGTAGAGVGPCTGRQAGPESPHRTATCY